MSVAVKQYSEAAAAEHVHDWTQDLRRGHKTAACHAPLTREHFLKLCSVPGVRALLLNAADQVATPAHCRHVRLNLHLASIKRSWSTDSSTEKTSRDTGAVLLAKKRASVLEAEAAVATCASQLASSSNHAASVADELSNTQQRCVLLSSVGAELMSDTSSCNRLSSALHHRLQHWTNALSNQGNNTQSLIETGVLQMLQLRKRLLDHNDSVGSEQQQDESTLRFHMVSVRSEVSEQGTQHNNKCLVTELAHMTRSSATRLQHTTQQLDLRADAAALRLQLEDGGSVKELEMQHLSGALCGVRPLLCQMAGVHVDAHLMASNLKQTAATHAAARDAITSNLHLAIKHKHLEDSKRAAVSVLVQQSIVVAGQRAALLALTAVTKRLQQQASAAVKEHNQLINIYNSIHSFEQTMLEMQHRLRWISASIEECFESIEEQSRELCSTASSALSQLPLPCPATPVTLLTDALHQLTTLPLPCLTALSLTGNGRTLQRELSMSCGTTQQHGWQLRVQRLLDQVVCGESSALNTDNVSASVCRSRAEVCTLNAHAQHAAHTHAARRSNTAHTLATPVIKGLCSRVVESDEALECSVDTTLNGYEQQLQCAQQALFSTRQALDTWWQQPAKKLLP